MKEKIISIGFVVIIFTFGFFSIILKDKDISLVERRKLANVSSLKEDFNENLDKYLTDQFPLRDEFLALNSAFNRYFLNNKDYNGVYLKDDYIFERLYPLDNKSVNNINMIINNNISVIFTLFFNFIYSSPTSIIALNPRFMYIF